MSTLSEIRNVDIIITTSGADAAAAGMTKVAGAEDKVTQSTERVERSTRSLANALERHQRSVDQTYAATKRLSDQTAIFDDALGRGMISVERHTQLMTGALAAFDRTARGIKGVNDNSKLASHEIALMGSQFSDIAVQLAGGQSPFLIAMQQGSQLSGQLGDRGVKGAVKALGQGLLAFVSNPLNLAAVGIGALGSGLAYLASRVSDVDNLDDAFRRHEETIRRVQATYGDAARGLKAYTDASPLTVRADLVMDRSTMGRTRAAEAASALSTLEQPGGWGFAPEFGSALDMINPKFRELATAITAFRQSARGGKADFEGLLEVADRLMLDNPGDVRIARMRKELIDLIEPGLKAQRALDAIEQTMNRIDQGPGMRRALASMDALATRLPSVGEAMEKASRAGDAVDRYVTQSNAMQGSPLDQALARERIAFDELAKSIKGTVGAQEALNRARAGLATREAAIRGQYGEDGRRLGTGESPYERAIRRGESQLRGVESEIATFGMSARAVATYRMETELLAEARQRDAALTADQERHLKSLAAEYGTATERRAQTRLMDQLAHERRQAPIGPEQSFNRRLAATLEDAA